MYLFSPAQILTLCGLVLSLFGWIDKDYPLLGVGLFISIISFQNLVR